MPKNVLNAISPILDYNDKVDNIDCRKAVFIFLSNTGGTVIKDHLLSLWEQGVKREDIELNDFESLILKGAFNEEGKYVVCYMLSSLSRHLSSSDIFPVFIRIFI